MELLRISRPDTKYVGLRHHGAYHEIGNTIMKMFGQTIERGIQMTGPLAGIYYDNPNVTPEAELRSDAVIPVGQDYDLSGSDLHAFVMPGGEFLAVDHIGSYSGLGEKWGQFMGAIAENHAEEADFDWTFEEYLNDCEEVGMENAHTRLFCRLK
ncbi:MAG: GyrI-like domain-containing protein [Fimbriimonadaceae bacterium]|nr:MAG: GyrI-like domain-containing protein [Fimbriimonadaceae bacterium]